MKNFILSLVAISPLHAAISSSPSHIPVSVNGRDLVYDSSRNLLYASVPSSSGIQYGNSIVRIDPSNGNIVGSNFAGSEPGKISLNSDNSRLYVGIDGARGFRWMNPANGNLSPINALNGFNSSPSIAQSFSAVPGRPNEIAISLDATGSSASGYLTLYRDSTRLIDGATLFDADQIAFASPTTLISYEDSSTGFTLINWTYDPALGALTNTQSIRGLISGFSTNIEISGPNILGSNGTVVDFESFVAQGSLSVSNRSGIEQILGNYLFSLSASSVFGDSSDELTLSVFDLDRFLQIDSVTLDVDITGHIEELIYAGDDRLAYITSTGEIGIISGFAIPEPTTSLLLLSFVTLLPYRRRA